VEEEEAVEQEVEEEVVEAPCQKGEEALTEKEKEKENMVHNEEDLKASSNDHKLLCSMGVRCLLVQKISLHLSTIQPNLETQNVCE
jgi:hypothetical protein